MQSDLLEPKAAAALPSEEPTEGDVIVTKSGTLYRFFKTGMRKICMDDLNEAEAQQVSAMRKLLDEAARRRATR